MTGEPGPDQVVYHRTRCGSIVLGDSCRILQAEVESQSIDLIMTSPPFGLVRKKDYGNVDAPDYLDWFRPFAQQFTRILKDSGSLVIDIGGAWIPGQPTRSLYHFKLLIMLCEEYGFHLAQEFYWWNPARLPSPAEWVTVRRIRAKDAINCVWWLSRTPWPKASNRRVLQPYSDSMRQSFTHAYKPMKMKRPSGHEVSTSFRTDNGAAIPPNLIALAHTESNSFYLHYCRDRGIAPHPARYPAELPEFFVRMLTDPDDVVIDPFAGSCVTGEVCERLNRQWLCVEMREDYVRGAVGRFVGPGMHGREAGRRPPEDDPANYYKAPRPDVLWNGDIQEPLLSDGGRRRPATRSALYGDGRPQNGQLRLFERAAREKS